MYTLTLTSSERQAIDWVGDRYSNGYDLYKLLWVDCSIMPVTADWDAAVDITFTVPEHVAWEIRSNAEQEDGTWPCFSSALASKMQKFVDGII